MRPWRRGRSGGWASVAGGLTLRPVPLPKSPTASLRALVAAGLLVFAGCKGRAPSGANTKVPEGHKSVTQTPVADASELDEDLRVRFLRLVAAGDEAFEIGRAHV